MAPRTLRVTLSKILAYLPQARVTGVFFSIKLRSVSRRLGVVRSGHAHARKICQPDPLAENYILRVILGFLLSPPPPLIIKVPRGATARRTSCNYHIPVTGDKGPNTHWVHGENIEITVNM